MSSWGYYAPPDDPARRVVWVLPLATAMVLLAMVGVGRLLRIASPRRPPPPLQARIYELPARKAMRAAPPQRPRAPSGAKAAAQAARPPRFAPQAPSPPRAAQPASAAPRARFEPRTRGPSVRIREPRGRPVARFAKARNAVRPGPRPHAQPVPSPPARVPAPGPPKLDLTQLGQQINEAVASTLSHSEFASIRDPHTLVAHYYLAAVLRKLHRVGEMTYLGDAVGQSTVMLVIGPEGELDHLQLYSSSGNPKLDRYALRIVRLAAPFPPFPVALERQTQRLKLVVEMNFEGYREVEAY